MTKLEAEINNFFWVKGLEVKAQTEGDTVYWIYAWANQFLGWISIFKQDQETILNVSLDIGVLNLQGDPGIALRLLDVNSGLPQGFRIFTTFNEFVGLSLKLNCAMIVESQILESLDLIHHIGFRVRETAGMGISPLPNKLLIAVK